MSGNILYLTSDSGQCDKNLEDVAFFMLLVGYIFSAFLLVSLGLTLLSMLLYMPIIFILWMIKVIVNLISKIKTKVKKNLINFLVFPF